MEPLARLGTWIAENEALLSGIAAMIVVAGVILTPLGAGLRRLGLVYAAHLGLVDDAYRVAEGAQLGPAGKDDDLLGPDAYRTSLLFQAHMPELRSDPRFPRLCARLGLVELWTTTKKWPDCAREVPYDFEAACEAVRDVPKDAFGFQPVPSA